jgi:hypothetical protein
MALRPNTFPVLAALALLTSALGAGQAPKAAPAVVADPAPAVRAPEAGLRRFIVVRTFPAGALAGLDADGKRAVNKCNATFGVRWVYSYANADRTKTFCIYEAPSEQAIRDAAIANKIPADDVIEVPVVLMPQ